MTRPALNRQTTPDDFLSYYWLKEELIEFLRVNELPASGSKQALTDRILQFLATGTAEKTSSQKISKRTDEMPNTFSRQSVIEAGWRCSQALRTFFEQEIGRHFHFASVMRDFIHHGTGKTLEEAIVTWEAAQQHPKTEKGIAPQFEYNRHIREYFKKHPGAALQEAIQAWYVKKAERRNRGEGDKSRV